MEGKWTKTHTLICGAMLGIWLCGGLFGYFIGYESGHLDGYNKGKRENARSIGTWDHYLKNSKLYDPSNQKEK